MLGSQGDRSFGESGRQKLWGVRGDRSVRESGETEVLGRQGILSHGTETLGNHGRQKC